MNTRIKKRKINNMKLNVNKKHVHKIAAKLILGIIIILIQSNVTFAAEYYVSTLGDNNNTGLSPNNAWKNPSYAVNKAIAGDTIYLINGTWYNETIKFANSGDSINGYISLTSFNGISTLDGEKWEKTCISINKQKYLKISGIEIKNYRTTLSVINSSYIIVDNCNLHSTHTGENLRVGVGAHDVRISNNKIHNQSGGYNAFNIYGEVIGSGRETYNITITHNELYDITKHNGINFGIVDNILHTRAIWNVSVTNNTIHDVDNGLIDPGSIPIGTNWVTLYDSVFKNNLVYNCARGISVYGEGVLFENNTVYNTTSAIPLGTLGTGCVYNSTYVNNNATIDVEGNNSKIINPLKDVIIKGESSNFTIRDPTETKTLGIKYKGSATVEQSRNNIFNVTKVIGSNSYSLEPVRYYPNASNCALKLLVDTYTTFDIKTYPITLKPSTGHLEVTCIKENGFNAESSIDENPTWINDTNPEYAHKKVNLYVDGILYNTQVADSKGFASFYFTDTWKKNKEFTFEASTEDFLGIGISGYVRSCSGVILSNVSISNNITPEVIFTDTNGYYAFTVPSNSRLKIDASKEGYNSSSICLNVCKTNISNVNIILTQKENKDQIITPEAIIEITSRVQIIEPNKPFDLDIKIEPETAITGAQLNFVFDSSMASANSVIEGNLFKQKGTSTFFNEGDINSSEGTIKHIYGLIIGTSNVSSPGIFATVNLTAGNKTGMAEFNLSNVLISDVNSKSVPYTVANASILIDTAPIMNTICCPKSVDEKSNLAFKVSAKDADCDRLTLSASGLPEGASFNRTSGSFAWTPAVGQAGVYTITFKVCDGYLTDSENVTVKVNKLNKPPVINFFEPLNGTFFSEGERIGILVNATDAEKQALNYSIKIDGVMYSSDSAYIWETDYSSSGNHTIEVSVSDRIDEIKRQHTIYISECHPRWDVNEDGVVNILDITNVSQKYEITVSKPYPRYDVNQDGEINILDLTLVGHHFGELVT